MDSKTQAWLADIEARLAAIDVLLGTLGGVSHPAASVGATANGLSVVAGTQVFSLAAATAANPGAMTAAYASKLDGIAAGATAGVTTIGAAGGSIANGASISGVTLTLGYADGSNPGLVSTGAQTWAGVKALTNPTIAGATLSGTLSGSPNFSGAPTYGGVDFLSQTNTVAGITNKTFTSPTINSATVSGTFTGALTFASAITMGSTLAVSGLVTASAGVNVSGARLTSAANATFRNATADQGVADFVHSSDSGFSTAVFLDELSNYKGSIGYGNGAVTVASQRDKFHLNLNGIPWHWSVSDVVKATFASAGTTSWVGGMTLQSTLDVTGAATLSGGATLTGTFAGGTFTGTTLTTPTINGATLTGTLSGGTFTSTTLTNPTINAATMTGTLALGTSTISGTPNFSGAATLGSVAILSQTNTVSGITNKSFTTITVTSTSTLASVNSTGTLTQVGLSSFTAAAANTATMSMRNTDPAGNCGFTCFNDSNAYKGAFAYGNASSGSVDLRSRLFIDLAAGTDLHWTVGAASKMSFNGTTFVLNIVTANGLTINGIAALDQTNTVSGITNKTFSSLTHSGTMALGTTTISGTPNFSGAATMNSVDLLNQTNTISGITNKTFTNPTINAAAFSGNLTGSPTAASSWTFNSGLATANINGKASGNITLTGQVADGASAVSVIVDSSVNFANAGAKLLSIRRAASEKAYFDKDGVLNAPSWVATAKNVHLVQNSITAFATGGQTSATALTGEHCYVTTCATGGDSVKLPVAVAGYEVWVFNAGAASCDVFPQSGSNAGAGTDTAVAVAAGTGLKFFAQTTTQWRHS